MKYPHEVVQEAAKYLPEPEAKRTWWRVLAGTPAAPSEEDPPYIEFKCVRAIAGGVGFYGWEYDGHLWFRDKPPMKLTVDSFGVRQ